MKTIILSLIKFYRKYLSCNMIRCCRFYPSCSDYAAQAVDKYGSVRGSLKAIMRVARCNPFSRGGYDPLN